MKRPSSAVWLALLSVFVLGGLLAACGEELPPTPLPTPTATPRSTPLPVVPTAIPLASEARPLTLFVVAQEGQVETAQELAIQLRERSGLVIEVEGVGSYGEVVARLCSASPAVGWLDGLAYMAAAAQGCADPALQIRRGRTTGFKMDLLISAELAGEVAEPGDAGALAGQPFCQVSAPDEVRTLVGELLLYRAGVNPLYDLGEIIAVADDEALVEALYEGQCMGGVVPANYLQTGPGAALEDLPDRVLIAATSAEIPYGVLVYPQRVPLHVRTLLDDALLQLVAERADALAVLPPLNGLELVSRADFEDLRAFMLATGLDFGALGE